MRRLDCSVPSASSVEVGEIQVVLWRWAAAWRGRSGLGALTLFQVTLFYRVKSETQLIYIGCYFTVLPCYTAIVRS